MGLEVTTLISGLTPTWPTGSERKSQGDDHIRLIKAVLQGTFPNASKAFYFPTVQQVNVGPALTIANDNQMLIMSTAAGNISVSLPSGFGVAESGWRIMIMKNSTDINAIIVSAPSTTILSRAGATATIRVGQLDEPATFFWSGTAWYCWKPGPLIGSTLEWNSSTLPCGYLFEQGSGFSSTEYAELYAMMGSNILLDKRGRYTITNDTQGGAAAGRITNGAVGSISANSVGNVGGEEITSIQQTHIPNYSRSLVMDGVTGITATSQTSNILQTGGGTYSVRIGDGVQVSIYQPQAFSSIVSNVSPFTPTGTWSSGGSGTGLSNIPPSITVNRIIRAC